MMPVLEGVAGSTTHHPVERAGHGPSCREGSRQWHDRDLLVGPWNVPPTSRTATRQTTAKGQKVKESLENLRQRRVVRVLDLTKVNKRSLDEMDPGGGRRGALGSCA